MKKAVGQPAKKKAPRRIPHNTPQETSKALAAFMAYCELGVNRSLAKLTTAMGKNASYVGQLERWSAKYSWVDRAIQYDVTQLTKEAEMRRKKKRADVERMNDTQAETAETLWIKAAQNLIKHLEKDQIYDQHLVALLKESWATHRLALGEATQISENMLKGDANAPLIIEASWGTGSIEEKES